jgi:ribokinase
VILIFGSINLDLVARVPRLPRRGETLTGDAFAPLPGGKGVNQALATRRAGATVALADAVGNDAFAAPTLAGLLEGDVDLCAIRHAVAPTGIALVQVDASGQNCITVTAGANAHADPSAVADTLFAPVTTLLLQFEVPLEAIARMVTRARALGARIVLNAAPPARKPRYRTRPRFIALRSR